MMKSPITKATAVSATGKPSVCVCSTAAPSKKFTPAPIKRPNDVQNANAVAHPRVYVFVCDTTELAVAAGNSINPGRWVAGWEELMG
jgi:hypothetical protein